MQTAGIRHTQAYKYTQKHTGTHTGISAIQHALCATIKSGGPRQAHGRLCTLQCLPAFDTFDRVFRFLCQCAIRVKHAYLIRRPNYERSTRCAGSKREKLKQFVDRDYWTPSSIWIWLAAKCMRSWRVSRAKIDRSSSNSFDQHQSLSVA